MKDGDVWCQYETKGNKRINKQNNDQSFPANPENFFPSPESGGQLDRSLFLGTIGIDKLEVPTHDKNQTGDRNELDLPGNVMVLKSAGGTHRQTPAEPKERVVVGLMLHWHSLIHDASCIMGRTPASVTLPPAMARRGHHRLWWRQQFGQNPVNCTAQCAGMFSCIRNVLLYLECSPVSEMLLEFTFPDLKGEEKVVERQQHYTYAKKQPCPPTTCSTSTYSVVKLSTKRMPPPGCAPLTQHSPPSLFQ
ncbi:hypothetical protein EYF80_024424 [Liparis tanakae]|uniref:Uncharacterized protein n=1 Tax=Liparis tanakae TaxID=230148 RepID=A0A4Z2HHS0_9TELE|nr:hypothetical protein EYF80_024424 [Liparis tanakae]